MQFTVVTMSFVNLFTTDDLQSAEEFARTYLMSHAIDSDVRIANHVYIQHNSTGEMFEFGNVTMEVADALIPQCYVDNCNDMHNWHGRDFIELREWHDIANAYYWEHGPGACIPGCAS